MIVRQRRRSGRINTFSPLWSAVFHVMLAAFSLLCLIPLLLVLIVSLSDEKAVALDGFRFVPRAFSLFSYTFALNYSDLILRSYMITVIVTVCGTVISTLVISLIAYPLSRSTFKYRKAISFFVAFTMLFNGGLVPWYIICSRILHLNNTILALILPNLMNAFYVIIMRTFFISSVPESLIESATMAGASEFRIFFQIVFPIAIPGIATIALLNCLGYWNDWFLGLMFIDNPRLTPVQLLLMRIENSIAYLQNISARMTTQTIISRLPRETSRMAIVMLAAGPLVVAYPFFQRYFVKGLTVGALKG